MSKITQEQKDNFTYHTIQMILTNRSSLTCELKKIDSPYCKKFDSITELESYKTSLKSISEAKKFEYEELVAEIVSEAEDNLIHLLIDLGVIKIDL